MAQQLDIRPLDIQPLEDEPLDIQPLDIQPVVEEEEKPKSLFQKIAGSEPAQRFLKGFSDKDIEALKVKGITSVSAGPSSFDVESGATEPSILPKAPQAETYAGGFLASLYEDFIRPLGTASGALGSAMPGRVKPNVITNPRRLLAETNPVVPPPKPKPIKDTFVAGPVDNPIGAAAIVKGEGSKLDPGTAAVVSGEAIPRKLIPEEPKIYNGKGAIQEGELLLPSAVKTKAAQNSGLKVDNLEAVVANTPEPVTNAVKNLIELEASTPSIWKSDYTQLRELSPDLWFRSNRATHLTRQYDAQWVPDFERAVKKLTNTEKKNFGQYVEGSAKSPSPAVDEAVNIWRQIESSIGDEASAQKLRLYSGKDHIPFQKNTDNYWPHIPAEKLNDKGLIQRLMKGGMTRAEANRVATHYRNSGEIVIGSQHARNKFADLNYRTDADAGVQHIRAMSRRIAQHREFGPLDVKGKGAEGIADLIEASPDANKALQIMQRIIGRDERANANYTKWLDRSRKYAAWTKLQNFTIPNMILGQGPTTLFAGRLGPKNVIPTAKEITKLFSSKYRDEIKRSGAVQNFMHSFAEELSFVDPYAIGAGETFNRYIAAAVGKSTAKTAFETLKKNPLDKTARKELEDLILQKADTILGQDALTNDQLRMAAGRAGEITQGLNVPGNLPHWASNPVKDVGNFVGQLMWTFKKMGYQATKSVWDSIKANPKVNVPLWMAVAQTGGELTGDVKAGIRGLWGGESGEEISRRGDWWLNGNGISAAAIDAVADQSGIPPEVIARMMDNFSQFFFLGLPADLVQSAGYGPAALLANTAGPLASDVSKLAWRIGKGDLKGIGKDAVKMLPVPGSSGLADVIFDD